MISPFYTSINFVPSSRAHDRGKFGRLLPSLPAWEPDMDPQKAHESISSQMYKQLPDTTDCLPSGYTYLGQFLIHDISFDPTSIGERQVDPEFLRNYRTPSLDLDSIYGGGPYINPYLYRSSLNGGKSMEFNIGHATVGPDHDRINIPDLPRLRHTQDEANTAVIPDIRNDEHLLISQLHTAFLLFHNKLIAEYKNTISRPTLLFQKVQELVRWHFQWIILHDYLPRIIDRDIIDRVLCDGRKHYIWRHEPFLPVEFSGAIFRFGHSQVRKNYRFNNQVGNTSLLHSQTGPFTFVDWSRFFPRGSNLPSPQLNKAPLIGPHLSPDLKQIPAKTFPAHTKTRIEADLAMRNLIRGRQLRLPSGQSLARALHLSPITIEDDVPNFPEVLRNNTPLWFYTLYEAHHMKKGMKLGPLASLVIAEVIIGLLEGDKTSFLNQAPNWTPTLANNETFTMFDLLDYIDLYDIYQGR